jgi:hypothetical protein
METDNIQQDLSNDAFIQEMRNQLTTQSGAISSSSTNIESAIESAIQGVTKSNTASKKAIESSFERQSESIRAQGSLSATGYNESRSGMATQTAVLRQITQSTATELKDLEQRKQELILQGDSATAAKIADLQLQKMAYAEEAKQRVFNNLLQLSNFGLSVKSEERASRAQDFAERQAVSNIALEFGLEVNENDTIDTIVAKAAPFADEQRKLKLEQIRADIANSRAQASRAMRGEAGDQNFDPMTAMVLAEAYRSGNTFFLGGLKTNEQAMSVYSAIMDLDNRQESQIREVAKSFDSVKKFNDEMERRTSGMNEAERARFMSLANKVAVDQFQPKPKQGWFGGNNNQPKKSITTTAPKSKNEPLFNIGYQAPDVGGFMSLFNK